MATSIVPLIQPPVFQASRPQKHFSILDTKVNSIFNRILSIINYIPKALYNGIHGAIGKIVYPAPSDFAKPQKKAYIERNLAACAAQRVQFKAADGAELQGAFFEPEKKSNITMIYYLGNGDNCFNRSQEEMQGLANQLGVNVLFFNYRDNYPSKGSVSKEGLILDGDAAFQYVQSLGYQEQNIILHGHSLGGAIAAQVAAMHPNVNYCNDRSFSKLTTEIKQFFGGGFLGSILATAANFFGWELNTRAAWDKIEGRKWIIHNPADGVILYGARLGQDFEGDERVLNKQASQALKIDYIKNTYYFRNNPNEADNRLFFSGRTEEECMATFKRNGLCDEDGNIKSEIVGGLEHCFNIFDPKEEDSLAFYKQQIAAIASKQLEAIATAVPEAV